MKKKQHCYKVEKEEKVEETRKSEKSKKSRKTRKWRIMMMIQEDTELARKKSLPGPLLELRYSLL